MEKLPVVKYKNYFFFISIIIAWIAFIFTRSLQSPDASLQESQWILNLIQAVCPVQLPMWLIRKMAHFTEYAVLGGLISLILMRRSKSAWRIALLSILVCGMVASCDEAIQFTISGRDGKLQDVCLDVIGGTFGIIVYFTANRLVHICATKSRQ